MTAPPHRCRAPQDYCYDQSVRPRRQCSPPSPRPSQSAKDSTMHRRSARVVSLTLSVMTAAALGASAAAADDLTLQPGFSAIVMQEGLGAGRHLAVAANGDIYLASRDGLVAMRDKNGDFKVDETVPFGDVK